VLSAINVGQVAQVITVTKLLMLILGNTFRQVGMCRRFGAFVVLAYINHMWYLECVSDIFAHLCDSYGAFATVAVSLL